MIRLKIEDVIKLINDLINNRALDNPFNIHQIKTGFELAFPVKNNANKCQ
jgi:hypothetical protein